MPWLEVSLSLPLAAQPRAEQALEASGAQAVTLLDADADTPDEAAIFEPGVGAVPLWPRVTLQGLFAAAADRTRIILALVAVLPTLKPADITFRVIADQDWTRVWMERFHPLRFGRRLWVYPWNVTPPADPAQVVVRLDPGLAFGTGTHPTTALCMEWLDAQDLAGHELIDFGCGSGVLAIAGLKLGAARAVGIDNDPQALLASRDNARRNGVDARLALYAPETAPAQAAEYLIANILARPLLELAPELAQRCRPGGHLALSGILEAQGAEILAAYRPWFDALAVSGREGWLRISGRRREVP